MNINLKTIVLSLVLLAAQAASSQAQEASNASDELKLTAIQALMSAKAERAVPVLQRVLAADNSSEVKSRALFVLGQFDTPEAHQALLEYVNSADGKLQLEAIRAIGISGDEELTSQLHGVYQTANKDVREAILQAYMIAGDEDSVFEIASNAASDDEFDTAVQLLGVMGATSKLQQLRGRPGATESLIHAYAIAGDTESLLVMARDGSNREQQLAALQGLGIAGGDDIGGVFYDIYKATDDEEIHEAVRHGILVSGDDQSAVRLFREATTDKEKAELLQLLVIMDSDAAMEAIDAALGGDEL